MIKSIYWAAGTLLALGVGVRGSVLADFNFNNLTAAPSFVVPNLSVTPIDRHDNSGIFFYAHPTNGSDSYLAGYYWTDNDYYEFQVTVPAGGNISLASVSFDGNSNLPSGDAMSTQVEYSTSSDFTNPATMGSFQVPGPFSSTFENFVTTSNPLIGGGGTYYFRIYNAAPGIQYARSYGLFLDNIQLNGTLTPTWLGDTNLDGAVDGIDVATLQSNSGKSVTGGYADGDLNGDGVVNGDDWGLLLEGLALYNTRILPAPEPAGAMLLCGVAILLLGRRSSKISTHP